MDVIEKTIIEKTLKAIDTRIQELYLNIMTEETFLKKLKSEILFDLQKQNDNESTCDSNEWYHDKKTGKNRCVVCNGLWDWHG